MLANLLLKAPWGNATISWRILIGGASGEETIVKTALNQATTRPRFASWALAPAALILAGSLAVVATGCSSSGDVPNSQSTTQVQSAATQVDTDKPIQVVTQMVVKVHDVIDTYDFTYDDAGNATKLQILESNKSSRTEAIYEFEYNASGQATQVTYTSGDNKVTGQLSASSSDNNGSTTYTSSGSGFANAESQDHALDSLDFTTQVASDNHVTEMADQLKFYDRGEGVTQYANTLDFNDKALVTNYNYKVMNETDASKNTAYSATFDYTVKDGSDQLSISLSNGKSHEFVAEFNADGYIASLSDNDNDLNVAFTYTTIDKPSDLARAKAPCDPWFYLYAYSGFLSL